MKVILLGLAVGLAAGLLGALCGVGGGIVMVPAFIALLGFDQKQAVATSLGVIIFTAAAATVNNARHPGLVDWKVVLWVGLGSAVAAWFGSDVMRGLSNQTLSRLFGCLLVAVGVKMLWK